MNPFRNFFSDEVFLRVRVFDAPTQVQELARLLLVDNVDDMTVTPNDQRPVLQYPPYDQPYKNDIVRHATKTTIAYKFQLNFQTLTF